MASLLPMSSSTEVEAFPMRTLVPMMPPSSDLSLTPPARTLQGLPFHVLARSGQTNPDQSRLTKLTLSRYSGCWQLQGIPFHYQHHYPSMTDLNDTLVHAMGHVHTTDHDRDLVSVVA